MWQGAVPVTRDVTIMLATLLMLSVRPAMAQSEPASATLDSRPVMNVDHDTSFFPERWCLKSQLATPAIAALFDSRQAYVMPESTLEYITRDIRIVDHSALANRLAALRSERLITFWQGRSLGAFFGVTENGHLGFSIGHSKARSEDELVPVSAYLTSSE